MRRIFCRYAGKNKIANVCLVCHHPADRRDEAVPGQNPANRHGFCLAQPGPQPHIALLGIAS